MLLVLQLLLLLVLLLLLAQKCEDQLGAIEFHLDEMCRACKDVVRGMGAPAAAASVTGLGQQRDEAVLPALKAQVRGAADGRGITSSCAVLCCALCWT